MLFTGLMEVECIQFINCNSKYLRKYKNKCFYATKKLIVFFLKSFFFDKCNLYGWHVRITFYLLIFLYYYSPKNAYNHFFFSNLRMRLPQFAQDSKLTKFINFAPLFYETILLELKQHVKEKLILKLLLKYSRANRINLVNLL